MIKNETMVLQVVIVSIILNRTIDNPTSISFLQKTSTQMMKVCTYVYIVTFYVTLMCFCLYNISCCYMSMQGYTVSTTSG